MCRSKPVRQSLLAAEYGSSPKRPHSKLRLLPERLTLRVLLVTFERIDTNDSCRYTTLIRKTERTSHECE